MMCKEKMFSQVAEFIIVMKCIYCTNVELFHLNTLIIKLNYGNQPDLIIIQVIRTSIGTTDLSSLVDNGRMNVKLDSAYFKQTKLIRPNNNNVINIYIVYKVKPIFRVSDYTVQNPLFGGVNKVIFSCSRLKQKEDIVDDVQ